MDESGKSGERRRKRRGGLRIPSDNVPRQADSEVSAPVPEDPKLAVSVAVAFGGGEGEDPSEPSGAHDLPESEASASDESVPEPVDDDRDASEESDDEPAAQSNGESPDSGPAVGLGALASDDEVELPDGQKSGDSVEIAFDDEEVAQEARAAGQIKRPRAQTMALSEEDLEEVMEEVGEGVGAAEKAAEKASARAAEADDNRATIRMPTLESPEPEGEPAAAPEAARAESVPEPVSDPDPSPAPAPSRDAGEAGHEVEEDAETRVEVEPDLPPTPVDAAPEPSSDFGEPSGEPSGDLAAAKVEAEQDPADSGEIISDDLIEEVDEFSAEAVEAQSEVAQRAPPSGDEEPSTDDRTPPPPPPPSDATPPPAPPVEAKPKPPPAPPKSNRAAAVAQAAQAKARRRRGKPWFEEIFEEDYLRTLPFLTPQATQAEAQFVEQSLAVEPGAQVLDVGCGYGRHAMELAARGYHVVALDASLPLLLRGADEAQRRGLDINFVHGDMRELTFDAQFDGAYCLFSTFGYFDDETNKKAAQNIARALKPGARLVIEVLNRDYLIADLPSRVWWEGDGCVILEEVEFNYFSSRIVSNRSVVFDDGRQLEQEISIRSYSLHEFGKLLHAAGFRVLEISGSMITRGRFFGNHSRDIIVVAERRALGGNGEPK